MREPTVARNYAEVLAALAGEAKDLDGWGAIMDQVAQACTTDERLKEFLASPRVSAVEKARIIGEAYGARMPRKMVRFLQSVVMHRRQHLLAEIAIEYHTIVDRLTGRVHAQVQVAKEPAAGEKQAIETQLARITGKTVVPHYAVQPRLLGGVVVRIGDTVMDGSLARRLASLGQRMLGSAAR
ncbi:MAG TPA: ATP synthase F1 subunit delta [Gemmatimonadaceae bacterium]|nr:ATP synthase F1 subunit delta [Gemmatimonadaceae bacterium]